MALTQVDQGLLGTYAQYTGFKNRIINGAMAIAQRGTSFTGVNGGQYTIDRFSVAFNASATVTSAQVSTAPTGFVNSWQQTVTTTKTPGVSDYAVLTQIIEGTNFDDLGWGTANAQTVTISFWVKSSIAGTYCIFLRNPAAYSRSYVATYTINSTNTWEQKTVTIVGDTTGVWAGGTAGALQLGWDLGSGSQFQTTAGSWQNGSSFRTSASTNWVSTSGATFNLTGVQLEKGSTATSFDYRPYGTELALCQRYYEIGTAYGEGYQAINAPIGIGGKFQVVKRATPTTTYPAFTNISNARAGADRAIYIDGYARYCLANATGALAASETFTASAEL